MVDIESQVSVMVYNSVFKAMMQQQLKQHASTVYEDPARYLPVYEDDIGDT